MAIKLQFKLTADANGVVVYNDGASKTVTIETGLGALHHTVQTVGLTAENLSLGDLSLEEMLYVLLINRDATHFVDVECHKDGSNRAICGRMYPGECFGPVRLPAQATGYPKLTMVADTAACRVEIVAAEAGIPPA